MRGVCPHHARVPPPAAWLFKLIDTSDNVEKAAIIWGAVTAVLLVVCLVIFIKRPTTDIETRTASLEQEYMRHHTPAGMSLASGSSL